MRMGGEKKEGKMRNRGDNPVLSCWSDVSYTPTGGTCCLHLPDLRIRKVNKLNKLNKLNKPEARV
jgi:hypothetical protein